MDWKHILINVFLLNGLVPGSANNAVVRGGWYVGTSIILYLLMPFLYRVYTTCPSKKWEKHRIWIFPLTIQLVTALSIFVASAIDARFYCGNNSFIYFSFVNQFPSFAIGFALYDWKRNQRKFNRSFAILLCALLGCLSVFLFFSEMPYTFVFVPTVFSACFCVLFSLISERIERLSKKWKHLQEWGNYSYAVYLIHSLVVYEGSRVVLRIAEIILHNVSHSVVFVIWLPIAFIIIYFAGRLFTKYLSMVSHLFVNKKRRTQNELKT